MKSVMFFVDAIVLIPHTATDASLLDRRVSLREFAKNGPMSFYELENGEFEARAGRYPNERFMTGPQA